jgi:hypothetical protein
MDTINSPSGKVHTKIFKNMIRSKTKASTTSRELVQKDQNEFTFDKVKRFPKNLKNLNKNSNIDVNQDLLNRQSSKFGNQSIQNLDDAGDMNIFTATPSKRKLEEVSSIQEGLPTHHVKSHLTFPDIPPKEMHEHNKISNTETPSMKHVLKFNEDSKINSKTKLDLELAGVSNNGILSPVHKLDSLNTDELMCRSDLEGVSDSTPKETKNHNFDIKSMSQKQGIQTKLDQESSPPKVEEIFHQTISE